MKEDQARKTRKDISEQLQGLAELLPRVTNVMRAAERACTNARLILDETSACLQQFAKAGLIPALPVNLYMINHNGKRKPATANEAEKIRQHWSGDFLLDLPQQTLQMRRGKKVKRLRLGTSRLHWGIEQVFIVGMSQPGVPFGFNTFSRCEGDQTGSGMGSIKTLTRYIREARCAIGDIGHKTRYIHKTRVDLNESPSRWGYVFDDRWSYLVIATYPPDVAKKSWNSRIQSIDANSSVNTSNIQYLMEAEKNQNNVC